MTLTVVDENRLEGQLTGALSLAGEEAGKERRGGGRTTDDDRKICAFNAREQRVDEGSSFMDANKFCNNAHIVKFERVEAKVAGSGRVMEAARSWEKGDSGNGEGTGPASGRGTMG